jgi:hypothetical protein
MNDKIIRVIVYGLILIFAAITIRSYSLRNYSAQQACIDNLRIVDNGGAMSVSLPEKPMPPDALLAKKLHQRLSQYYKEHKHYPDSLKDIIASNVNVRSIHLPECGRIS